MNTSNYNYGMIGLGTMGANLVLNMSDNGFSVLGYDKNPAAVEKMIAERKTSNIAATTNLQEFVEKLEKPRVVLMLVPAGKIVDSVIDEISPMLQDGDILVDCGNSFYADTQRRVDALKTKGIHFMGMGISGGETGARNGASIMPGGDLVAYKRIVPMLQAVAAKVDGEPCTAYMGNGAAGHYVKMVHNGIEYGLMQLIAETYQLLKNYGGFSNQETQEVFAKWNTGPLKSFLVEITAAVLEQPNDKGSGLLVDYILDTAAQKGTGAWTSQDAMKIGAPIPVIDAAVSQRILSSKKQERVLAAKLLDRGNITEEHVNKETLVQDAERALYTAFIITYAQGLEMLAIASNEYGYNIDLASVSRIWRGGCIIRAEILEHITKAYEHDHHLANIMIDPDFLKTLKNGITAMKRFVNKGYFNNIPMPAFSAAVSYFDSYFSSWLPANLIQAQRDFFGAHTYQRIDGDGNFHTEWNKTIQ